MDAVNGKVEVYVDGGIRLGTDGTGLGGTSCFYWPTSHLGTCLQGNKTSGIIIS